MPWPEIIRVKLSSEGAEYISITPVVVRDMPLGELVELMLGVTGKDAARIRELLLHGAFSSGATRFRWSGFDADRAALDALLARYPDAEPALPFDAARCTRAVLKGPACRIEIPREAASKRRLLRGGSFWDTLLRLARSGEMRYLDYSYQDRGDWYRVGLSAAAAEELRASAKLLAYGALAGRLRRAAVEEADLLVERAAKTM